MIYCVGQNWEWVPSSEATFEEKTPEMNELETCKKILKIWAHNFEKQKSYRHIHFWKNSFFPKTVSAGRSTFNTHRRTNFIYHSSRHHGNDLANFVWLFSALRISRSILLWDSPTLAYLERAEMSPNYSKTVSRVGPTWVPNDTRQLLPLL